jgi:YXWGXW repeat-containing protein
MKRVLGAFVLAAATLLPAAAAHAQVGIAVRIGPAPAYYAGYAPPCPGPGYIWTDGYYAGSVWIPGRWAYHTYYGGRYYGNGYYHRDWDHGRDAHYNHYDHDHDHGWGHDHDGWHR